MRWSRLRPLLALQRSRGMDGPRWLGWLTVAALALLFAALYAFTQLRPTPQTGGVDANRFLLWGLGALALAALLLLLVAQGVGRPQRRLAHGLARAVQSRPPMFATPWRARRRRRAWRSWLLLLLALAAAAALAPPRCLPLLAQRRHLARVLQARPGVDRDWLPWLLAALVLLALVAGLLLVLLPLGLAQSRAHGVGQLGALDVHAPPLPRPGGHQAPGAQGGPAAPPPLPRHGVGSPAGRVPPGLGLGAHQGVLGGHQESHQGAASAGRGSTVTGNSEERAARSAARDGAPSRSVSSKLDI